MPKMITLATIGAIIALFVVCIAANAGECKTPPGAVNVPRLLEAIAAIESTSQKTIGPSGERSIYQLTSTVWQAQSNLPFEWATRNQDIAYDVANKHVYWIRARLHLLARDETPYNIALVWHAGYGRCLQKKLRTIDYDYAQRVENWYNDQ